MLIGVRFEISPGTSDKLFSESILEAADQFARLRGIEPSDSWLPLTDVAGGAAALLEIFVDLAAAHRPLGIPVLEPPRVAISAGSTELALGGGLFASGVGLIVACSAGLVAAPVVGPVAGGAVAVAGLLELAVNWKKKLAEARAKHAEARKSEAEAQLTEQEGAKLAQLEIEAKKLEIRAKKMEIVAKELKFATDRERVQRPRQARIAYSSLVPREQVIFESRRYGLSEVHANHILNRVLPKFLSVRRYFGKVALDTHPSIHRQFRGRGLAEHEDTPAEHDEGTTEIR